MSSIEINSTSLPSELAQILDANQVQVGSQVSYQLCKLLWEYHPLAGKIIEKPIRLALSKTRKINIPCAIEDQLKEAFEREWERLGATNHIRDTMYLSRVYGAAAIVYGAPDVPTDQPIDPWQLADMENLYFNQLDPLNLAGSIVTNQNPNAPDFQKPSQNITAAGQPYHPSRSCTVFCGTPIYLSFQGSSFSFSGRSLFLRALYPLKSFIQTMTVDDLVSLKSGLLIAKIQQSGSIVNRLMQSAASGKRDLLREGQTGNVLSITPEESIESIDLNNTDKAMTTARNNIIANIAAACDVPAILLKDEAYTQGFGEGTEDAKAVAQYIEALRHDMASLFQYFDKIVQHRAWNPEFYQALANEHPEEIGGMSYEQFFYFAQNLFKAEWPTLIEEPESEIIRRDSDKLKAMSDVLKTLGDMLDPENKARAVEWFTDNINGMTKLFASPMELDIEALAQYEPPQPQMGGFPNEGGNEGGEPEPQPEPEKPEPPKPEKKQPPVEGRTDAEWKESDHPRDESGKFTSGGGGGGSSGEPAKSENVGFKRSQKSQWMGTGFGKMPATHELTVGGKDTGFTISGTRAGNYYVYDPSGKKVETSSSFELAKEAAKEHYDKSKEAPQVGEPQKATKAEKKSHPISQSVQTISQEQWSSEDQQEAYREIASKFDKTLTEKQKGIEKKLAKRVSENFGQCVADYSQLEDAEGGKVLNTDVARELSPDYDADRTQSAAVHEPASWFIKQLYSQMLSQPAGEGEDNVVMFTGGGTGAGKSSAIKNLPALSEQKKRAQIVYDTNMADSRKAIEKIDQALAAGKKISITYVYRDPVESLAMGALTRAMGQEKKYGSGRTVPVAVHLKTHVEANKAIREIAEHYKDNNQVQIAIIDNTRGRDKAAEISIADLPNISYDQFEEEIHATLERERSEGRISESVYRGFKGETTTRQGMGESSAGQPEQESAGKGSGKEVDESKAT